MKITSASILKRAWVGSLCYDYQFSLILREPITVKKISPLDSLSNVLIYENCSSAWWFYSAEFNGAASSRLLSGEKTLVTRLPMVMFIWCKTSVRHLISRRRWSGHIVNLHFIHIRIYIVFIVLVIIYIYTYLIILLWILVVSSCLPFSVNISLYDIPNGKEYWDIYV